MSTLLHALQMCSHWVQVHRIQNKLLWAAYAASLAAMKVRWRLEPKLALVNGGASTLWHGTSKADPWDIYAAEFGGSPSQPWSATQSHVPLTVTAIQ